MAQESEAPAAAGEGPTPAGGLHPRYVAMFGLAVFPLALTWTLNGFVGLPGLPLVAQWVLVVLSLASALYLAGLFALPRTRDSWLTLAGARPGRPWTCLLAVLNTPWISIQATAGFAVVTGFLHSRGLATADSDVALTAPVGSAFRYYLWHLADSVPLLDLPYTLGWDRGVEFVDSASRALLACYKIVVVTPLVSVGVAVWKRARATATGAG